MKRLPSSPLLSSPLPSPLLGERAGRRERGWKRGQERGGEHVGSGGSVKSAAEVGGGELKVLRLP